MPIISIVGRKATSVRVVIGIIYALLILGSITVLYPFVLMLSISLCSAVDVKELRVVPEYVYRDDALFLKYVNDRYGYFQNMVFKEGTNIDNLNDAYRTEFLAYEKVALDVEAIDPESPQTRARVADWIAFKEQLPSKYFQRAFERQAARFYHTRLAELFDNDVAKLNRSYLQQYEDFSNVILPYEDPMVRSWEPTDTPRWQHWQDLRDQLPHSYRIVISSDARYAKFLKNKYLSLDKLNDAHGTRHHTAMAFTLSPTAPAKGPPRDDWETFVRKKLPFRYLELTGGDTEFATHLKKMYGTIKRLNQAYASNFRSFDQPELSPTEPESAIQRRDWQQFVSKVVPLEYLRLDSPEARYHQFLKVQYGTIDDLNRAYGTSMTGFAEARPPVLEYDYLTFDDRKARIRFDFLTRNYTYIIKFMITRGRAFFNTMVIIAGTIIGQLLFGPLCAYALSRYRLRYTNKILLFMLATMAFPAEIAMIPAFLLLKQLDMLNTYWALILPHLVNGYYIFLLKGFFDSIPRELFETADLEGASELRIFWSIVVPLSTPILAVIALWAFTFSYGSFMWAFVVCQNPKLWTLMVFIYQLQMFNPEYLVMAALTIASIPPLIVFILAQRVIMKGIVIPVMK